MKRLLQRLWLMRRDNSPGSRDRPNEKPACHEADPEVRAKSRTLFVPEEVALATWRALRPTAEVACEGVALWAGPKAQYGELQQVVTTVVVPRQRVSSGRYELPTDAVREMGRLLRRRGLVNVAQVHSHPGTWVGHSEWDDAHAFSLRNGAVSIVWPGYARELPSIDLWGVHECRAGVWVHLAGPETTVRVVVVPLVIDLRIQLLGFDHMVGTDREHDDD
jgi:hypothetical protein